MVREGKRVARRGKGEVRERENVHKITRGESRFLRAVGKRLEVCSELSDAGRLHGEEEWSGTQKRELEDPH